MDKPKVHYFYAQGLEDQWIVENLPLPEKGFYVDVGAAHPRTTSNTAFLRDLGWEGLAIDGDPVWSELWQDIPTFICAVISNEPHVQFFQDRDNPYCSRIGEIAGATSRATVTIEECLSSFKVGKIDFLSVDVEGKEFDVLRSFNFELHDPPIIMVEWNTAGIGHDDRCRTLLGDLGYDLKLENTINLVFAK